MNVFQLAVDHVFLREDGAAADTRAAQRQITVGRLGVEAIDDLGVMLAAFQDFRIDGIERVRCHDRANRPFHNSQRAVVDGHGSLEGVTSTLMARLLDGLASSLRLVTVSVNVVAADVAPSSVSAAAKTSWSSQPLT